MHFVRVLLAVILVSGSTYAQPKDMRNLGFESRPTGINPIDAWARILNGKQAYYHFSRDSNVVHSGAYSLRITYDSLTKGGYNMAFHQFPLDVMGKKLRLSAWVRQAGIADTAGAISCVVSQEFGEVKTIAFGSTIARAKDWTFITREIALDSFQMPIHHLRINVNPINKDTLWIDDIRIEIDGKNIEDVPSPCSPKGEIISPLTIQQIHNLAVLCKAWGFLKYFHPRVTAGKYNWDLQLFQLLPIVKAATSDEALNKILLQWIHSLGEIPACAKCYTTIPADHNSDNVDLAWMKDARLSKELRSSLQHILSNRHMGKGYFAQYQYSNIYFTNENEYNWREIEYPNELFRLQFLFRYWNSIQYFYPYKNIIGEDWNDILVTFLPRFAEASDLFAYHYAMSGLINSVNDSHSGFLDPLLRKELVPYLFPARITIIDNKAVITQFPNDSIAGVTQLQIGDVIEKVNGRRIKDLIAEFLPIINGSNYPVKLAYLCSHGYITGGRDSIAILSIRRDNKKLVLKVKRYPSISRYLVETNQWKLLKGDIGLINMDQLLPNNVDSMFRELMHTRALIFDLRHYPNGIFRELCRYLYTKPMESAKTLQPNLDFPGTFKWGSPINYGPGPNDTLPHYAGKIVILVNSNTQSRAEWTAMALQAVPGSITIGSQTSGTDGNVSSLNMTGNYKIDMTGLGVFYPDGTPTQQRGVKIDFIVHPTVKGIRERRDEILEKALELLNK